MNDRVIMAFSGSAKATPEMLAYTEKAVCRAMELGHYIYVGDNPGGVDLKAIEIMAQADYKDFAVINVVGEPCRAMVKLLEGTAPRASFGFAEYHQRDRQLADMCNVFMGIWDGRSKGTKAAFDYAVRIGREAFLVDFSRPNESGKRPHITKVAEE